MKEKQTQTTHKNKKRKILLGCFIPLGTIALASAITLPLILKKADEGVGRDIEIDSSVEGAAFTAKKTSDGIEIDVRSTDETKQVVESIESVKIGGTVLTINTHYSVDDDHIIVIYSETLSEFQGKIVVEPKMKDVQTGGWSHDFTKGAYVNKVPLSTIDFINPKEDFNDIYLSEVAKKTEIFGSDILTGFNRLYWEGDPYKENCKVTDVEVNVDSNGSYSISFKMNAVANGPAMDWESNGTFPFCQSLNLTFKNVKFKFIEIINSIWKYEVDLDNTATDWSIVGTMTKNIDNQGEQSLTVDIGKDKTEGIEAFKTFAYTETVKNRPSYLILNNVGSYHFKNVSSTKVALTKEEVAGYKLTMPEFIYNKSKTITCKITPDAAGTAYFPSLALYYYDENRGDVTLASWTADDAYDTTTGDITLNVDQDELDTYFSDFDPSEVPLKVKISLNEFSEIQYGTMPEGFTIDTANSSKYGILHNAEYDHQYNISKLTIKTTDEAKKALCTKFKITVQIADDAGETGEPYTFEHEFTKSPEQDSVSIDTSITDSTSELNMDYIKVSISKIEDVDCKVINISNLGAPEGWQLADNNEGLESYSSPHNFLKKDTNGNYNVAWRMYYPEGAANKDEAHDIVFTLTQGDKTWKSFAYQSDDANETLSNTDCSFSIPESELTDEEIKLSVSIRTPESAWISYEGQLCDDDKLGFVWENKRIYNNGGTWTLKMTLTTYDEGIETSRNIKIGLSDDDGTEYGFTVVTLPVLGSYEHASFTISDAWPETVPDYIYPRQVNLE